MRRPLVCLAALPLLAFASLARAQGAAPSSTGSSTSTEPPKGATAEPLIPASVDKSKDAAALEKQGDNRPGEGKAANGDEQIFSDSWWTHTRPILEIHGFFRTRAELFHNFALGRVDPIGAQNLFPRPADDSWTDLTGALHPTGSNPNALQGCGPTGNPTASNCTNKTNASANMRFRIDPEIHISDNLRILTQIDMLDNLVLGSTPEGYGNTPSSSGGYTSTGGGGRVPLGAFATTQVPPTAGLNSYQNSVSVKRVWAEYMTPLGQIRFGRMPSNWGLGILVNSGDTIDSDYQTTADRIMFITGSKQYDLYIAAMWDFPNSGKTSANLSNPGTYQQGQPYNVAQLDNVSEWALALFKRTRPDVQQQKLARGEVVLNYGLYSVYRQQILANEQLTGNTLTSSSETYSNGLVRVGARAFIPDLWLQVLTKHMRWETEASYIYGSIQNPQGVINGTYQADNYKIRELGIATEFEYHALNDDLKLRFWSGFASGDQGSQNLSAGTASLESRTTADKTISTFRFHPDYRVDLILWRNIMQGVQGAYYFRPGIEYDFTKSLDGEKLGGRAEIIWSRASQPVQTPGHKADLGIEIDLSLYYQSKDGSLNDDPRRIGGFYSMLQWGVLFPLGGLGYQSGQTAIGTKLDTSTAQIVRLFLGVAY